MANYDKQFNVNKGLSVKGTTVIDENRNVAAAALTVTSNTLVTNLNAEMVGGKTVSLLGVTNANSVISGAWDFQTAPLFSGGASGYPPFAVSAGSTMVTNLNAEKIADKAITSLGVIDAARTISATWTYTAAPYFNTVGEPFTVASTTKVANLNADLLDGANADTGDLVSTIAMRDSSGNLTAKQFSMTAGPSSRTTDTVFYSGVANDIYKNTLVGFKTSLGLNLVDNVSINSWTGSANIVTLGAATSGGKITANTFKSNVATGTAPFEVSSLTMVANLNAQYVNGKPSSDFVTVSGTSFYLGSTAIPLSSTTGQISYLTGISISGSAGSAGSAGWVSNSLTFADATTWNGSAAKTLNASHVGAVPTSALASTLTGTTINATTLQQGGTAISSLFMPLNPGSISVTSTVNAGNYFKTTGTGLGNGFIVGSVTGGAATFTTDANTTVANALLLTGGDFYVKNLANNAYKNIYAFNLYDYSSGSAVKVSLVDHNHTGVYLPLTGGTLSGNITVSGTGTNSFSGDISIGAGKKISAPTAELSTALYVASNGIMPTSGTTTTTSRFYQSSTDNNYWATNHIFKAINGATTAAVTISGSLSVTGNTTSGNMYTTSIYTGSAGSGLCCSTAAGQPRVIPGNSNLNTLHLLANTQYIANSSWGGPISMYIGASGTTSSVDLYGNLNIYGDVRYTTQGFGSWVSDIRLKRDIRQIDNNQALNQMSTISNLGGIIGYRMKSDPEDAKEILGVSAQVIAEVVPQASGTWDMNKDGTEYLTWNPGQIIALLIASVARLNERLTALENSIAGSI